MVDIPVTFGTNASTVTPQIHGAAAATEKAAGATVKHTAAAKMADAEAIRLAKSSALVTAATKAEASAHDANTAALHRATAAAREHAAAGDIAQGAMHEHTHAGWTQAARVGGFRHEMHAAEFAEGAITGGIGGLAVGGALVGALVMEKFFENVQESTAALRESIHADFEFADKMKEAAESVGKMGVDAVGKFGSQIIDLTSRGNGLKDLAKEFSTLGINTVAASNDAALLANRLFPGHERQAMQQATVASSIDGESVFDSMKKLQGLPVSTFDRGMEAAKYAVTLHRGKAVDEEEFDQSAGLVDSKNQQTTAIHNTRMLQARGELAAIDAIGVAPSAAAKDLGKITNPEMELMKEQLKAQQQALEEAIKTRESLNFFQRSVDNILYSINYLAGHQGGGSSTLSQIDKATTALHNTATRGAPAPAPAPTTHTINSSWGPITVPGPAP